MTIFTTFKDFIKHGALGDIQKKCAPFLEQSEGLPLFRGYGILWTQRKKEVVIRKDRKPRDSSKFVHDLMDAYFEKKFGHKARSAGLFATGNAKITMQYGAPYYVLPVGDFKFIWGEYEGEPVKDTLKFSNKIKDKMRVTVGADAIASEILDEINWHMDDLPRAIKSGAEIAILADKAILIPYERGKTYHETISR